MAMLLVEKLSVRLNKPELNLVLKDFQKPYVVVGGEVQQPGGLVPHPQDVLHDLAVVPSAGTGAHLRGAGAPGFVEHAAQFAGCRIGHHGDVGRLVELQQPAFLLLFLGGFHKIE